MEYFQISMKKLAIVFLLCLLGCTKEVAKEDSIAVVQEDIVIDRFSDSFVDYLSERFDNQKYVFVDEDLNSTKLPTMEIEGIYQVRVLLEEKNTVYDFNVDYKDITPPVILETRPLMLSLGILPSEQVTMRMIDDCIDDEDNSGRTGVWMPENIDAYLTADEIGEYEVTWKSGDEAGNMTEFKLKVQVVNK